MKNKLFSRGLYVEGLRQLKIVGAIFLAILLLIGIAVPVIQYVNYIARAEIVDNPYMDISPDIVKFDEMCGFVFVIALVAAPIFSFILFSPFNKRSASDFYHSLPYKRTCMFFSFAASVLTWLAAITVITCGLTIMTYALMPKAFIVNLAGMGDALLTVLAYVLMLVFGIIAAMSLTGTPLANVTAAGLLLFLPRLLITIVTFAMAEIAPIIDGHFGIFGTDYNALVNLVYRVFAWGDFETLTDNIASDIYSIIVGLLYAALAAYLFTRRKSETAGHAAPGKLMHHIIRICVGLVISATVSCAVICGFEIEIAIVFYIVSVIIYFAYELITQKTFKTIKSTLPGLAILVVLNVLIIGVAYGCAAYVHSYTPEADDVEAIYIENPTGEYYRQISFGQYALEKAGQIRIDNKDAIKIATDHLKINNEHSKKGDFYSYAYNYEEYKPDGIEYVQYTELNIVYVSNAGIKRTRNIYIPVEDYGAMMDLVQENEAYKEVFYKFPEAVNRSFAVFEQFEYNYLDLSDSDLNEIFECLKAEIRSLDFTTWATYLTTENNYNCFEFSYIPVNEDLNLNFYFDGAILPKTTALVMEKTNKNTDVDALYEILSDFSAAEDKYESIYLNMQAIDELTIWDLWFDHYEDEYDSKYNSPKADDVLVADLKALAEAAKTEKLDPNKFIMARVEYSDHDEPEHEDGYKYYNVVAFLPYPADFKPQSDAFEIFEYYEEGVDSEIKYEYVD